MDDEPVVLHRLLDGLDVAVVIQGVGGFQVALWRPVGARKRAAPTDYVGLVAYPRVIVAALAFDHDVSLSRFGQFRSG